MGPPRPGDPGFQAGYTQQYAQQGGGQQRPGYGGAGAYAYGSGQGQGAPGGNSPAQPGNPAHMANSVPRQPVCFFLHVAARCARICVLTTLCVPLAVQEQARPARPAGSAQQSGADPQVLWEDTKKWVDQVRKACSSQQQLLIDLQIEENVLKDWYSGRNASPQITTRLRQQIKVIMERKTQRGAGMQGGQQQHRPMQHGHQVGAGIQGAHGAQYPGSGRGGDALQGAPHYAQARSGQPMSRSPAHMPPQDPSQVSSGYGQAQQHMQQQQQQQPLNMYGGGGDGRQHAGVSPGQQLPGGHHKMANR
jgi:hypothetical protein